LAAGQGTVLDDVDLVFPDGMVVSYFRSNQFDPTGSDTNGFVTERFIARAQPPRMPMQTDERSIH
jgi:hypothetical protein